MNTTRLDSSFDAFLILGRKIGPNVWNTGQTLLRRLLSGMRNEISEAALIPSYLPTVVVEMKTARTE
jgi:hypothetical protein